MKKLLAIISATAILASSMLFVGCAKTTECEICGEKTKCNEIELYGEKGWVCSDCEAGLDALAGLADMFS